MTTPTNVRALAEAVAAQGGAVAESVAQLEFSGRPDLAQTAALREFAASLPSRGMESVVATDEQGDTVDLLAISAAEVGRYLRISVRKPTADATAYLFTQKGLATLLIDAEKATSVRQIWIADEVVAFRTEAFDVGAWTSEEVSSEPRTFSDLVDPRRLVKDLSGGHVPQSIAPYLLVSAAPAGSAVLLRWKQLATRRLVFSLVNEVWLEAGRERVLLSGPRAKRVDAGPTDPLNGEVFDALMTLAHWVYGSGRDAEVRHGLLTYELAREWPDDLAFTAGILERAPRALESAKTSYQAHLQDTSKDTLKALSDLRKALSEEVAKVVAHTRDVLTTMWRDFMVAATAFLGRIVLMQTDKLPPDSMAPQALLYGAALFLAFSLWLTLRSNSKFLAIGNDSRKSWRTKLYGFLPDDDLRKLSDQPLSAAETAYNETLRWVIGAYLAVFICLVVAASATTPRAIDDEKKTPTGASTAVLTQQLTAAPSQAQSSNLGVVSPVNVHASAGAPGKLPSSVASTPARVGRDSVSSSAPRP
jgi:hypothetical protein